MIFARKATGRKVPDPDDPELMIDETINIIPARYNLQTGLTAVVQDGGDNAFPYELDSK